ncbi:3-deoxy-manno-octulosonate cytidylyltransferase [soil metagenome]
MSARTLAVVPARLASVRLPRKPLHPLAGRPLVQWVWERACAMDCLDEVVVATDSEEVAEVAAGFGATVELTAAEHPSGTDRVAEVAVGERYRHFPLIVNLQGDEPFITPEAVVAALELVRDGGWEVGTVATRFGSVSEWLDPAAVKVVSNDRGGALLFSRAPIPHLRGGGVSDELLAHTPFLRHLGVYAYRRAALLRWVGLPEGTLERIERLEQLRPLAAGIPIGVAVVEAPLHGGIDTAEDALSAERLVTQQRHAPAYADA